MTATITQTAGFVGNLTADPELRFSQAGKPWASFKLAVRPYVAGASEQPEPVYYSVVCFGSLAEHVCESLHKGDRVVVTGRLEEEPWTGRDGVERITQKVICDAAGRDLRFSGTRTTSTPKATEPVTPRPDTTIDGLLNPGRGYTDEPF